MSFECFDVFPISSVLFFSTHSPNSNMFGFPCGFSLTPQGFDQTNPDKKKNTSENQQTKTRLAKRILTQKDSYFFESSSNGVGTASHWLVKL